MKPRHALLLRRTLFWLIWVVTVFFFSWEFYSPYGADFFWNDLVFPKAMIGPVAMLAWSAIFLKSEPNYTRGALIILALLLSFESIGIFRK